jgi:hypothetical protein
MGIPRKTSLLISKFACEFVFGVQEGRLDGIKMFVLNFLFFI